MFPIVIQYHKQHIKELKDEEKGINARLTDWEKGEFDTLISSTLTIVNKKIAQIRRGNDDFHCAKLVTSLIFEGNQESSLLHN